MPGGSAAGIETNAHMQLAYNEAYYEALAEATKLAAQGEGGDAGLLEGGNVSYEQMARGLAPEEHQQQIGVHEQMARAMASQEIQVVGATKDGELPKVLEVAFQLGAIVRIQELRTLLHLNGQYAAVLGFNVEEGKWRISLQSGDIMAVKRENLVSAHKEYVPKGL